MISESVQTDGESFHTVTDTAFDGQFSSFLCRLLKKQFFHRALKVMKKKPEKDAKKEEKKEKEKDKSKGDSGKEEEKKGKKEKKKEPEAAETKKEKSVCDLTV